MILCVAFWNASAKGTFVYIREGYPECEIGLYTGKTENCQKQFCQGKHRECRHFAKTQGILLSSFVNFLIQFQGQSIMYYLYFIQQIFFLIEFGKNPNS